MLLANEDFSVPFRSVIRVPVGVRSARGSPVPLGLCFVSGQAHDKLGVRDSLSRVNDQGNVFPWLLMPQILIRFIVKMI